MERTHTVPFADLLRRYRSAAGLTQEALAERAQLSRKAISALERGDRLTPRKDTVALLAAALALSDEEYTQLLAAARLHRHRSSAAAPSSAASSTDLTALPSIPPLELSPTNLPRPPTPLIGREQVVAQTVALLRRDAVHLVTLTGPGGVGKTRLALEVAARLRPMFTDGVFLIPLAALTDPDLVAATIVRALGIQERGGQPTTPLTAFLRNKCLLLLLDNFEHLLSAAAVLSLLLAECPRLKVLVTSQAVLQLRGEHVLPISPFPVPDTVASLPPEVLAAAPAVALFVERAQAVRPEFMLTLQNAADVAAICRRLDGLPLALELAAARVRLLPPRALLERLERRLPTLVGGARDLPERHRTLRDTIAWSYDLLAPPAQTRLRRLSVGAGGATLEAAEAICCFPGHGDALESLAALLDHSLLRLVGEGAGEPRYGMLETIREYAGDMLTACNEREATERAHAMHYLALVEEAEPALHGPEQGHWMRRLEADVDNLRAALHWAQVHDAQDTGLRLAGALWYFWLLSGRLREGRGWLEALLAAAGNIGTQAVRAKATVGASWLARSQGAFEEATALAEEGLALYDRLGDRSGRADALTTLACVAVDQGEGARARPFAEESLALRREQGDGWAIRVSLNNLGYLASVEGDNLRAREYFAECLDLSRAQGDIRGVARSLQNLGDVVYTLGNAGRAHALMAEALALLQNLGLWDGVVDSIEGITRTLAAEGQPRHAVRLLGAASSLRVTLHDPFRPSQLAEYDQTVTVLRDALSAEAFEAAWAEGAALSPGQAIAAALTPV